MSPPFFAPRRVADLHRQAEPPAEPTARTTDSTPDDEPLTLPDPWTPPRRPPFPLVAATVPVIGAVVLWLVTGSFYALLLAGLGPLIAIAGVVDHRRGARRDRRVAEREAARARRRVSDAVRARHDRERARRRARHPDALRYLTREDDIWRAVSERRDGLVVGEGETASAVRVTGGGDEPESRSIRAAALRLVEAPVVVAAGRGIVVTGAEIPAAAVHRALILQRCLAVPPGDLRIVGNVPDGEEWIESLPHRHATTGTALAVHADLRDARADEMLVRVPRDGTLPPECAVVLTVDSPMRARLDDGECTTTLAVEAISVVQAEVVAADLSERAARTGRIAVGDDAPVAWASIPHETAAGERGGLTAVLGTDRDRAVTVDLVHDGPHAVVAGVTGAGKSELLITWILSLAAVHSPREVSFLLADFKGGTAFDGLRELPHVTGVITDLDGAGALRAIESLNAEMRWREREFGRRAARDISDARVDIPRLVVVVDEFAALLAGHPELQAVFSDVAARGRALGVHLILGTQRVAGVIRDGLLANCPLRISLRVTDAADSRAVIGVEDAALLPGSADSRGMALVRAAADSTPQRLRVALSTPDDVAQVAAACVGAAPARRPWLPPLPASVSLAELLCAPDAVASELVVGLADEPDRQRQRAIGLSSGERGLLVVGGPGAGKSVTLETLASQSSGSVRVPATAEALWDTMAHLDATPPRGAVVVIDDIDTIATRLPADHAQIVFERIERLVREAGTTGIVVVVATQRLTGPVARIVDLLPRRLILATTSRAEHIAAGGDPAHYAPASPPGRGRWDGLAVQVAQSTPDSSEARPVVDADRWFPRRHLTGFVTRRMAAARGILEAWAARGIRIVSVDDYRADPTVAGEELLVVVGDPDEWQREWRLLGAVRADHDLVIDTSCAADYRMLAASRDIPPYAGPGGRAWLLSCGEDAVRIVLPDPHLRSERHASVS
ncbi:FtsK/SpoIIIE domain-containing protein [Microbacterium koreense]|uniref:FtsK/SpoIIIE domain-containing protein n=1 Tax=Microbacterium koreense TaxID=323761 RepID=A0ABW2ZTQ4_9MICO